MRNFVSQNEILKHCNAHLADVRLLWFGGGRVAVGQQIQQHRCGSGSSKQCSANTARNATRLWEEHTLQDFLTKALLADCLCSGDGEILLI